MISGEDIAVSDDEGEEDGEEDGLGYAYDDMIVPDDQFHPEDIDQLDCTLRKSGAGLSTGLGKSVAGVTYYFHCGGEGGAVSASNCEGAAVTHAHDFSKLLQYNAIVNPYSFPPSSNPSPLRVGSFGEQKKAEDEGTKAAKAVAAVDVSIAAVSGAEALSVSVSTPKVAPQAKKIKADLTNFPLTNVGTLPLFMQV